MGPVSIPTTRFVDYRKYVRAWLDAHHARSMRSLASKVGVHHSFVSMVLRGKRSLSVSDARRWAEAMRLDGEDQTYFEAMVRWKHGATAALRRAARVHLDAVRTFDEGESSVESTAALVATWYLPVLIEMARNHDFREDPEWLAERIWPRIGPDEVRQGLALLERVGALTRDETGRLRPVNDWHITDRHIHQEELNRQVFALHQTVLANASEALTLSGDHRYLGLITLTIRKSELSDLIGALHQAQVAALEPYRAPEDADHVVTVSLQVVPHIVEGEE